MKKTSKDTSKPVSKAKETRFKVAEPIELLQFLLLKMGGMRRNAAKSLLSHRQVMVNDKISTLYNMALFEGDKVVVNSSRGNLELSHPKLKIIFEDQYLLVVEKKEGLLTVSTGKGDETTAFSILKDYVKKSSPQNRIFVVHRIDRETSGILVFAKTREIQLAMQERWHEVVTERVYVALVEGKVEKQTDTIISWLTENEKSFKIHSSTMDNGGQQAITHYRCVKSNEKYSLLEVELETGRKNQIRVHAQSIGHPIVGDKKYGSLTTPIGRMGLHARILAFIHPMTLENVRFETAVPRNFLALFH
ncbi:MAG: RNA pseudouridine synthase [Porphyromonadaceae bacterium CG2_30_38_12]|nr:MAG: RNA pseudouridine synthase [Porphyromonadaceae bacterium CG2_30_38_12]